MPRKNKSVIRMIFFFSRKAEARYVGRSTVMQHGAKSATIPAKKAARIEALKISSILIGDSRGEIQLDFWSLSGVGFQINRPIG